MLYNTHLKILIFLRYSFPKIFMLTSILKTVLFGIYIIKNKFKFFFIILSDLSLIWMKFKIFISEVRKRNKD